MKYQITCPKCKHEFEYNAGEIEAEIRLTTIEIQDLMAKLAEFKTFPFTKQQELKNERRYWVRKLERLSKRIVELKAIRKQGHDAVEVYVEKNFKRYVKEEIGEARYVELWDKARKEAESYNISDMAKVQYTSNKKPVTSINKL